MAEFSFSDSRLNDEARAVIGSAYEQAFRAGDAEVRDGYLILALFENPTGSIIRLLNAADSTSSRLESAVRSLVRWRAERTPANSRHPTRPGGRTPLLEEVIWTAIDLSRRAGFSNCGSLHLLGGLVRASLLARSWIADELRLDIRRLDDWIPQLHRSQESQNSETSDRPQPQPDRNEQPPQEEDPPGAAELPAVLNVDAELRRLDRRLKAARPSLPREERAQVLEMSDRLRRKRAEAIKTWQRSGTVGVVTIAAGPFSGAVASFRSMPPTESKSETGGAQ